MKIYCATRASKASSCRAFTLAEPAIGIAIIVVLIIAFYGGVSHAITLTRMARENQRASQILVEKSEVIRMCKWQQLTNGYVPDSFTNTYSPNGGGVTYYGSIAIANAPVNAGYSNNLKAVTVAVRWTSGGGLQRSREMRTLISQWGLNNYVN